VVTVFVSDPTAEAERVAQAMRAAGYAVVDVPLSMLVARVAVQHPQVILVDADGEGALDVTARMRELPDAEDIHVLLLAQPGGAVTSEEEALAYEASGLFVRPVDVPELVRKVGALAGHAPEPQEQQGAARRPSRPPSSPPPSMRAPLSRPAGPGEAGQDAPRSFRPSRRAPAIAPPISPELRERLDEAERRVQVSEPPEVPSPEDEIEAILPAELLAALDEPLDEEDEDEVAPTRHQPPSAAAPADRSPTEAPHQLQPITNSGTHSGSTGTGPATGGTSAEGRASGSPDRTGDSAAAGLPLPTPEAPAEGGSVPPPTAWSPPEPPLESAFPAVVGPGEAVGVLARAISGHQSGSFCFATEGAERRVVLREGDITTAVSSAEDESLLAFLATRGDLPRETVRRLGPTFPAYGRHAGAALVARGYLRQDQLWPTLRAHAEWVLGRAMQARAARLFVESQAPGRLQGEPSVFGGSPGAAVLVEVVRRVVAPEEAIERMSGIGSRIGPGPAARLLGECGLAPPELAQVQAANGHSIGEALDDSPDGDLAALLFALSELGVVELLRSLAVPQAAADGADPAAVAALDAEAIRERVRARTLLVDDGDYFSLLGVARDATGYEVRRAFLDLRRAFDPSRVLTPETADLADDVRKIVSVLEEAYAILKDAARRERYRRAIEDVPR
jgi:hypothetical protein